MILAENSDLCQKLLNLSIIVNKFINYQVERIHHKQNLHQQFLLDY